MVAMLIMLVGLLGLLQAVNLAMEHNLRNQLRDEAVLIAEQTMGNLKTRPFSNLSGVATPQFSPRTVKSQLRGGNFNFTMKRVCTGTGTTTARLTVTMEWRYKGTDYSHSVTSIRSD